MGLFDDLAGSALGSVPGGGNAKSTLLNSVLDILTTSKQVVWKDW
jgi:hypothetical protein